MNRAAFYAALRRRSSGVFGTSVSEQQVRGIAGILDAFVTYGDGRAKTPAYAGVEPSESDLEQRWIGLLKSA